MAEHESRLNQPAHPEAGLAGTRPTAPGSGFILSRAPLGRLSTRPPLVGRTDELAFLRAEFDTVAAGGDGRLIFIGGEPGVGKTRLVQELGSYARQRGGRFLEGYYLRDGTAAYGPWVDALRAGLHHCEREELIRAVGPYGAELSQLFPEWREHLGRFRTPP